MGYLTYFDLVESLIVSSYGGAQDAEQRDIRTAIHRAYDELTTIRDWAYYHVHGRVITRAPVTATLTGGTDLSAGLLEVSGGLAASDYTHVRVGDRISEITCADPGTNTFWNLSDTVTFPSGTVASGDTAVFFKSLYALPDDFRNLDEPSDEYNWWSGLYVTPDQAMKIERVSNSSGEPYHWTILKDPNGTGWVIKLVGYPTTAETIDFIYRRNARPIRYSGHEPALRQGTIARSNKTETGTGTAFSSAMVGSILRVGDTTNHPGPIESFTPWISESKITAYSSATAITTETSGTIASSTKYLITDPMDVAQHMQKALDSCCDYWLARIRGVKAEDAFSLYQRDLRLAMEQDQLAPISGRSRYVWHDGGWRSPLQADVG